MKIEFDRDLVQDLMAMFGKEEAINQLVATCRSIIESGAEEIEKELTRTNG